MKSDMTDSETSGTESDVGISAPYNIRHSVHVNKDLIWNITDKDPENIFDKISIIGEGSFGTVWKILHKSSGILMATKIIGNQEGEGGEHVNSELKSDIENEIN